MKKLVSILIVAAVAWAAQGCEEPMEQTQAQKELECLRSLCYRVGKVIIVKPPSIAYICREADVEEQYIQEQLREMCTFQGEVVTIPGTTRSMVCEFPQ